MRRTAAFLLSCICLFVCACEGNVYEIDLSRALMENGEYSYPGLSWGISPEDAEALLGFSIEDIPHAAAATPVSAQKDAPPVPRVLRPVDDATRIKLNGNYGTIRLQFHEEKLVSVSAVFKEYQAGLERNNLGKLFETTDALLREQFGDPAVESVDQAVTELTGKTSTYYRWEGMEDDDPRTRNSQLSLGHVKDAQGNIVSVSVMLMKSAVAPQAS